MVLKMFFVNARNITFVLLLALPSLFCSVSDQIQPALSKAQIQSYLNSALLNVSPKAIIMKKVIALFDTYSSINLSSERPLEAEIASVLHAVKQLNKELANPIPPDSGLLLAQPTSKLAFIRILEGILLEMQSVCLEVSEQIKSVASAFNGFFSCYNAEKDSNPSIPNAIDFLPDLPQINARLLYAAELIEILINNIKKSSSDSGIDNPFDKDFLSEQNDVDDDTNHEYINKFQRDYDPIGLVKVAEQIHESFFSCLEKKTSFDQFYDMLAKNNFNVPSKYMRQPFKNYLSTIIEIMQHLEKDKDFAVNNSKDMTGIFEATLGRLLTSKRCEILKERKNEFLNIIVLYHYKLPEINKRQRDARDAIKAMANFVLKFKVALPQEMLIDGYYQKVYEIVKNFEISEISALCKMKHYPPELLNKVLLAMWYLKDPPSDRHNNINLQTELAKLVIRAMKQRGNDSNIMGILKEIATLLKMSHDRCNEWVDKKNGPIHVLFLEEKKFNYLSFLSSVTSADTSNVVRQIYVSLLPFLARILENSDLPDPTKDDPIIPVDLILVAFEELEDNPDAYLGPSRLQLENFIVKFPPNIKYDRKRLLSFIHNRDPSSKLLQSWAQTVFADEAIMLGDLNNLIWPMKGNIDKIRESYRRESMRYIIDFICIEITDIHLFGHGMNSNAFKKYQKLAMMILIYLQDGNQFLNPDSTELIWYNGFTEHCISVAEQLKKLLENPFKLKLDSREEFKQKNVGTESMNTLRLALALVEIDFLQKDNHDCKECIEIRGKHLEPLFTNNISLLGQNGLTILTGVTLIKNVACTHHINKEVWQVFSPLLTYFSYISPNISNSEIKKTLDVMAENLTEAVKKSYIYKLAYEMRVAANATNAFYRAISDLCASHTESEMENIAYLRKLIEAAIALIETPSRLNKKGLIKISENPASTSSSNSIKLSSQDSSILRKEFEHQCKPFTTFLEDGILSKFS